MTQNPPPTITPRPWHIALPRIALKLAVIVLLVLVARWAYTQTYAYIETLDIAAQANARFWILLIGISVYALIIAIPFVPAVEIAIALMIMEGPQFAPFVYVATVLGLFLAFLIGQRVSVDWIAGFFADLRMMRASQLIARIKSEPPTSRLATFEARLPRVLAPIATRYRYVTLAILLSVPGNAAIGGGGGIMMIAGISRLFTPARVFLTLLIGVAPVPLIVWLFGVDLFA